MRGNQHRNSKKKKRPSITIMTLLACEEPRKATDLLLENGQTKAKDFKDLESKLAQAYHASDDKAAFEKKLAAIHPHHKWFMRVMAPEIEEKKKILVQPDPPGEQTKVDPELISRVNLLEQRSDFFGVNKPEATPTPPVEKAPNSLMLVGIVTVTTVAIFGLALVTVLSHNKK